MESKRLQNVLRWKFGFRIIILIITVAMVLWISCFEDVDGKRIVQNDWIYFETNVDMVNFIFGVAASGVFWSIVELFDLIINTKSLYCSERNKLIFIVDEYLCEMINVLSKKKNEEIDWEKFRECKDELWGKVARYPFECDIYTISEEFQEIANYIWRLSWKFDGCFFYKTNEVKKNAFYSSVVSIVKFTDRCRVEELDIFTLKDNMDEMAKIELNFEPLELPKGLMIVGQKGNLGKYTNLTNNYSIYTTFLPRLIFEEKVIRRPVENSIVLIFKLLWRTIK